MTKEEANSRFISGIQRCETIEDFYNVHMNIVNDIYEEFENQECTGCRYFDLDKDDFDEKCTLCSRFHEDYYEVKTDENS